MKRSEPKAVIVCSKSFDTGSNKNVNAAQVLPNRVDAALQHVCSLPVSANVSFNGFEYMPAFKEPVEVDTDIFFHVLAVQEDNTKNNSLSYIQFQILSYSHDIHYAQNFIENCLERMEKRLRNK